MLYSAERGADIVNEFTENKKEMCHSAGKRFSENSWWQHMRAAS
jgi:hypothetical protein